MNFPSLELLQCPQCVSILSQAGTSLVCQKGHSIDIARQGYVNLMPTGITAHSGDSFAMVEARSTLLESGLYAPILELLTRAAVRLTPGKAPLSYLDIGAGTGYYTSGIVRALSEHHTVQAIAADSSPFAARRLSRVAPVIGAIQMDAWKAYPLRSGAIELATIIFAPRNPAELDRIMSPQGNFLVLSPAPTHLQELISEFTMIHVDVDKEDRLLEQMKPFFNRVERMAHSYPVAVNGQTAHDLIAMGPSARHIPAEQLEALRLDTTLRTVTIAVTLDHFRRF
jgi:23S rRNA (guanine745-N1)-methyltransferase